MRGIAACLAVACALATTPAAAHKPSDAYLTLETVPGATAARLDIALRDLEQAIGLDADGDGGIDWGELKARREAIEAYAFGHLAVRRGGLPCPATARDLLVAEHADGVYAALLFALPCRLGDGDATIDYRLMEGIDPLHRGLMRLVDGERTVAHVFIADRPGFAPPTVTAPFTERASAFVHEGLRHIAAGLDHVLFVVTLVVAALTRAGDGRLRLILGIRGPLRSLLQTITAFTLAHTAALSLAALGLIAVPPRLVESLIAASIAAAALNIVWPVVTRRLWAVAFAFGLVHGLGFAGSLGALGLAEGQLLLPLLGFNVGVELGQLAIVALVVPFLYGIALFVEDETPLVRGASAAIAAIGLVWLAERALGLSLLLA